MPKTVAEIEAAIELRIQPVGFESPPYQELFAEWDVWLDSLSGDDLFPVIELGFRYVRGIGKLGLADPYLSALTDQIVTAGGRNPEKYLEYAEFAAEDPQIRPLFILTAGELYYDQAVEWLATIPDRFVLSDHELSWTASSLLRSGIPIALPALDRVIAQIRARKLPILDTVVGWRAALVEHLRTMERNAN